MEYKFTFTDGSKAIAHYGVSGMKWGQWNEETKARYANAGNGTYFKKATHGTEYGKAVTDQRRKYNANQPKGKQILKNVVMTPGGAHAYNTSRSRGLSRSESVQNAAFGPLYAQGVKLKQMNMGTTKTQISNAAKMRSEYSNSQSMKKDIAKNLLMTPIGATNYNTVKAATKSRGKALVAGLAPLVITGAGSVGAGVATATALTTTSPSAFSGALTALKVSQTLGNVGSAASYIPRAQSYIKRDFMPKANKKPKK